MKGLNNYIVLHACLQCTVIKVILSNLSYCLSCLHVYATQRNTFKVLHKMMGCSINETGQCLETTAKLYPKRLEKYQICLCSVCFKFDNELGKYLPLLLH